jgi:hypothetical protein
LNNLADTKSAGGVALRVRTQESLDAFARRPLAEPFLYLILDARYEKVREGGVVMSQAVLIAIGIDWDGRRQILAVDMANREASELRLKNFDSAPLKGDGLNDEELYSSAALHRAIEAKDATKRKEKSGGPANVRASPRAESAHPVAKARLPFFNKRTSAVNPA